VKKPRERRSWFQNFPKTGKVILPDSIAESYDNNIKKASVDTPAVRKLQLW